MRHMTVVQILAHPRGRGPRFRQLVMPTSLALHNRSYCELLPACTGKMYTVFQRCPASIQFNHSPAFFVSFSILWKNRKLRTIPGPVTSCILAWERTWQNSWTWHTAYNQQKTESRRVNICLFSCLWSQKRLNKYYIATFIYWNILTLVSRRVTQHPISCDWMQFSDLSSQKNQF